MAVQILNFDLNALNTIMLIKGKAIYLVLKPDLTQLC